MASEITVNSIIKVRRDTTENWALKPTILQEGELGYDSEKKVLAVGDGTSQFTELTPIGDNTDLANKVTQLETDKAAKSDVYTKAETDANFVQRLLTSGGSKALIFNETDGGGIRFENESGLNSMIAVHDGTTGGFSTAAQIAATRKSDGKNIGTRLNVFEDKIVYLSKAENPTSALAFDDADHELAVKKDITAISTKVDTMQGTVDGLDEKIQEKIDEKVGEGTVAFHYKGTVATADELANKEAEAQLGDVWQVTEEDQRLFAWDGDSFEQFGVAGSVELEKYVQGTTLPEAILAGEIAATAAADKVTLSIGGNTWAEGSFSNAAKTVDLPLATVALAGLMAPADKDKLDKLPALTSSEAENKIKIEDDGSLSLNTISIDKLTTKEGFTMILDGGHAEAAA